MTPLSERLSGALIFPALLVVIGIYCVYGAVRLGFWQGNLPGSGFMPLIYGLVLTSCALPVLMTPHVSEDAPDPARKPLILISVLVLTVAGFRIIGGIAALFLMLMALFIVVERLPPLRATVVSVVTVVLFYYIFVRSLSVALPTGPWGF